MPEAEEEWKPIIVNWIESDGTVDLGDSIEIRKIEEEIGKGLHTSIVKGRPVFRLSTENYSDSSIDTVVERLSKQGVDIQRFEDSIEAPSRAIDLEYYTKSKMPRMSIIDDKVWIRLDERDYCRTAENLDPKLIDSELEKFEKYVESQKMHIEGTRKQKWRLQSFFSATFLPPSITCICLIEEGDSLE